MSSSGSYVFAPILSDIVVRAFGRLQVRGASMTPEHLLSAKDALNLVFVRWSNKGINWWQTTQEVVPLDQGVKTYDVPSDTVSLLPYSIVIRNYNLGSPVDVAPSFSTTSLSTTVTIDLADNGFAVDWWINIIVPVSIGGIVLSGFYQVTSIPTSDSFTITAADEATSTVSAGGAVPSYATTANDATVTVTFANHGLVAGDTWNVSVQTNVGGLQLLGDYTVESVTTNTFTFSAGYNAGSTDTADENGGETQIAGQTAGTIPTDRIITALSNVDYQSITQKEQQAQVTSFWYNRQINPTITLWPVPDGNGPYELRYWRMRQIQTATPRGTQTADVPYRFLEALIAGLAFQLALEWKPEVARDLMEYADLMFQEAASEDREKGTTLNTLPDMTSYYQM